MLYNLDGEDFAITLPTDADYEFLADLIRTGTVLYDEKRIEFSLGGDEWEEDPADDRSECGDTIVRLVRLRNTPKGFDIIFDGVSPTKRNRGIGFRPVLFPCNKKGIQTCGHGRIFDNISDGTELKMYSLLINGEPVPIQERALFQEGDKITFTDTYFDDTCLIPWIVIDDVVIAKYNLLYNASWDDLRKLGFA